MRQIVFVFRRLPATLVAVLLSAVPASSQSTNAAAAPTQGANAQAWVQFGKENLAKNDFNGAISAFSHALQLAPNSQWAYFGRGFAHEGLKEKESALADYDKAIAIDPDLEPALLQRGGLKGQLGDFDAAITDFNHVIKIDPKSAGAYYNLGHVYYFKGDPDKAMDQLSKGLSLEPDTATSYFIRGLILHAQQHREEALADFQKSVGLNYPDAAFWIWICQTETGRRGVSRQDLTTSLGKTELFKPDAWPAPIANFLLENITQDQLIAAAGQGISAEDKDQQCAAWFYAGIVKHFAGDDKAAHDCFQKSVATGSKSSEEYVEATRLLAK